MSPPLNPNARLSVRISLRPGERWRAVLFRVGYGRFGVGEVIAVPEEEGHRLAWLGVAETIGFQPDAGRGEAEQQLRAEEWT